MATPASRRAHERAIGGSWVFYALVLVLVAAPAAFGAVYQWTWAALAVLVGLLLLASTPYYLIRTRALPPHQRALWLPAVLYALAVAWTMLQASGLTPASWDHPVWARAAQGLGGGAPGPQALGTTPSGAISLDPYATWSESLKMLSYAGVFWLAAVYGRDRGRARNALWALAAAGCLYAAYGLTAFLTDLGATLWWQKMPQTYAGASSTFVNRNMYVDYAGFGLLSAATLILSAWISDRRLGSGRPGIGRPGRWRSLAAGRDSYVLLLYTMGLILLTAVVMTGSRGGALAVAVAAGALISLSVRRLGIDRATRRHLLAAGLALAAAVALVYAFAGAHLGGRFAEAGSGAGAGRLDGYRLILRAIADAPWTGYGAGTSIDVFYLHNDGSYWTTFNYAHNVYLGAAVELGLPAAAALIASVGLVAARCLEGIGRRARDQALPALGVGATVLVAVHGLFDSPLYLAANAATFAFLLGLAYAQSWPTRPANAGAGEAGAEPSRPAEEPPGRNDRRLRAPGEARSG